MIWVLLNRRNLCRIKKLGRQRNNHLECGDGRIFPPVYRSNDTHVDGEEQAAEKQPLDQFQNMQVNSNYVAAILPGYRAEKPEDPISTWERF